MHGATSEYGIEFLIMLAHHVYWTGLSIDKARKIMEFYTEIDIPKSQADKMLYQSDGEKVPDLLSAAVVDLSQSETVSERQTSHNGS